MSGIVGMDGTGEASAGGAGDNAVIDVVKGVWSKLRGGLAGRGVPINQADGSTEGTSPREHLACAVGRGYDRLPPA